MGTHSSISSWREVQLEELCSKITVGHVGPMRDEYVDFGIPFLRSQNIQPFRINEDDIKFISPDFHVKLRKSALQPGDVAIVRTGYPGTSAVIPSSLQTANCADLVIARPNASLNPHFLAALLNSSWGKATVSGQLVGVAQQHFNVTAAKEMRIRIPDRSVQDKIASILSAYDDLIENNLRRIKILEEMAQNLYREWFVNFRFPGHEKARFVDSPLGRIPEGWDVVPFTGIADVLSGGTPKTNVHEYWNGPIPFFAPKDTPDSIYVTDTEKSITELGLSRCNSRLYPKDTVFITARGTVGKVVLPAVDMAINQSCYALRGKDRISQSFLFHATVRQVDYLKKNTGGATFDTIIVDTFRRMQMVRPAAELVDQFSQFVQPLMELILNVINKNRNLRHTRDLLLPKLISGELDVSELEIQIPDKKGSENPPEPQEDVGANTTEPQDNGLDEHETESETDIDEDIEEDGDDERESESTRAPPIDLLETDEVMAAFRQAARRRGSLEREELIKEVSKALGYRRLGPRIRQVLRGHLIAANLRNIIEGDRDVVWIKTPRAEDYSREELIQVLLSVMRKDQEYDREEVTHAAARHIGFTRVRESVAEPIRSAINGAIRRDLLGYDRNRIWRKS